MTRLRWLAALLVLAGATVPLVASCVPPREYRVDEVSVDGGIEYRFYQRGVPEEQHFMTLIAKDGALSVRPHPGVDPNGWGSSWYPQPFLAGAVLGHSGVDSYSIKTNGILVKLSGGVSRGASDTYGDWEMTMTFRYDRGAKAVTGSGGIDIVLDGPLANAGADLNLGKIASNYLDNVPLLGGGTGDTGDMAYADVEIDDFTFTWIPPDQPAHYPVETGAEFSVALAGDYNEVDTAAQGYDAIAAAYKPSLELVLEGQDGAVAAFGGQYDTETAQDFWEDNVGVTPLVFQASSKTEFVYEVAFRSEALPEDGS
jgi:hypothetical protein